MEPQKDKDDVGLESGMTWANKAPATESKDTEADAPAAENVEASPPPTDTENEAPKDGEAAPAQASAEVVESPAASEGQAEAAPSAESATEQAEAEPSKETEAAPEKSETEAEASRENSKDQGEENSAAETTASEGEAAQSSPDSSAAAEAEASPEEAATEETKSEDTASEESSTDTAEATTDTASEEAKDGGDAAPAPEAATTPPPLDTVREGIVGKNCKKDDTQRVKIQKPDDAPAEGNAGTETRTYDKKQLETQDEEPSAPRKSGKKRAPHRSAAQDAVIGAVVFIDDYAVGSLGETPPSPFTKVGGVSMLRRAVLTARDAGLTTLHCLTKPELRDLATQEVTVKGVEAVFLNSLEDAPFPKEGRVIYIDPRAIHDVDSLKRLQKWRGARVALLCSKLGDGIRVQIEGVRVREIGTDLVPFDACTGGAISIPMELMPRILDEGYQKMLRDMVDEELLGASFSASTTAREVRRESELDDVRSTLLSNMGLNSDGFMDRLIHRRISNHLTRSIYTIDWIKPSFITSIACVFGLLAGPLFALSGSVAVAAIFATLSLWLSVILDSVDGELARLKQEESSSGRFFDRCAKTLVHLSVISGIISWFGYDNLVVLIPAAVLALGQIIGAFISYSQAPRLPEGHQISLGDRLEGLILNQNYFYLACPLLIVAAFLDVNQGSIIVAAVLALLGALVHLSWIGLKVVGTEKRQPS